MKIADTLDRDPRTSRLANNGQARITSLQDERARQELRAELETFVCDGQYGAALKLILERFLEHLDRPRQESAWVSGFFGSGKSHLLKMLEHLWVDSTFPDGSTARSLVRQLPDDVVDLLQELNTHVTRSGKPALAAAGSLPSGTSDRVRLTVLSVILRACGWPEQYAQARFCLWLRDRGHLDQVRSAVEAAGKDWPRELHNLYVSGPIAKAVLACDPNFAADEQQARQVLRAQFPLPTGDITTAEFIESARAALSTDEELPLTILVLDEVQQYIGDSSDRAVTITEIAEAVQTQMDSRVMLIASGQSALSSTPLLQRLRDRFRIQVQLSDTDVETVTRKVLLQKKPSAIDPIRDTLNRNAGEVSKQLAGTRLAERNEDRQIIVEDYPLLPTRRRFWEECFHIIDTSGTHAQLRSQLRILDEALKQVADRDLGRVIPADVLYDALAPDMVNSGVLLNELSARIQALDDGTEEGRLKRRLCGLTFLANKLPRDAGVDTGVRATPRMLADLLVDDLDDDSGPFRKQVETLLEALAEDGTLMKVGDEYRLQTTQGAEWDRAFREKVSALRQNEADIANKRDQLLGRAVQEILSDVRLQHGESKLRRTLVLHQRDDEPQVDGDQIVVWVRDQWSGKQKDVENEARRRGQDDPVLHVFLPRKSADELRSRIIEAEAARMVIDLKGVPSENGGKEAYQAMQSRLTTAEAARDELIREIVASAKVYQGGGNEVFGNSLREKVETAAKASLARLFPRFNDGDHKAWEVALRRAREGNDQPFTIVGWDRATEEHPVAKAVLNTIGSGAKGGQVRKELMAAPYGWPKDAIDAALIALHRMGTLRVTHNGQPLSPGQLDQNRIQPADFHPESVRLGTSEKIAIRGLFQSAGVSVRTGEEDARSDAFLQTLLDLANAAGGEAPLPAPPDTTKVQDLRRLAGTDRLGAILQAKDELEQAITDWTRLRDCSAQRVPAWKVLERLLAHARALPIASQAQPEVDAIRSARSLLENSDHVTPIRSRLTAALRAAVTEQAQALQQAYDEAMTTLASSDPWRALDQAARDEILHEVGLRPPVAPTLATDDDLLRELDRQALDARADAVAAVPARVNKAMELAARKIQPQARRVPLRPATLESEDEVKAWLAEHEKKLLAAVKDAPVIIG